MSDRDARRLAADFESFRDGLPPSLEGYVLDAYGINLGSTYAGYSIKNPFGKASGQLSLALHQVEKDGEAGLGFVVLKTVIAQDRSGGQTMREWAIPETRMQVERIRGRSGAEGWTVTWKGRGWSDTFEAYCNLFDQALGKAKSSGTIIASSVKYHLPTPGENFWKEDEYAFTTRRLLGIWDRHHSGEPMPLEKDFSPTLAGSARAAQQAKILEWLRTVPGLIHRASPGRITVGLKIFNAMFEDEFQLQMLEAVHTAPAGEDRADFLVYGNRLFDPGRAFEGKTGVAYGGPDLSDRNLGALERFYSTRTQRSYTPSHPPDSLLPVSATGDIHSGRIAAEYLLRGSSSFQMHTLFQLPDSEFEMRGGNKSQKALHRLLFQPREGFLAWVLNLRELFSFAHGASVLDMANWSRDHWSDVVKALAA